MEAANACSISIIPPMVTNPFNRTCPAQRGFTLIELLVTLAVAAVLASLAAPSIRDFIVRSKMTNLSNEFSGSVLRARNEAVNRNVCVTLCMSSSGTACTTTGTDWQAGWIGFLNLSRPLKNCFSNASGRLMSKTRAAQTRLRSDCNGPSGRFAVPPAHFGRTYPWAHA